MFDPPVTHLFSHSGQEGDPNHISAMRGPDDEGVGENEVIKRV